MKPLETTIEEVLQKAIQSEVDTRAYYQAMAQRAASDDVRARLLQLADGELVHRARLERRYKELLGQNPPDPQAASAELPADLFHLDMKHALKHALERERDSESYFRFMAERVPPETDLGRLFVELAETEWKHKTQLQAEYDSMVGDEFLADM